MLKNEKGITLLILVIMVMVLGILLYAGINAGTTSVAEVNLQNFSYEMQQIQGRVDSIHEKMSMEDEPTYVRLGEGAPIGQNVTVAEANKKDPNNPDKPTAKELLNDEKIVNPAVDYNDISIQSNKKYYPETGITAYRYLSPADLKSDLGITNAKNSVIINFETREVISLEGFNYYGTTYYTRKQLTYINK